jgi:hypothetical protein
MLTFEAREPVVISIVWTIESICIVDVYMCGSGIISPNYPQTPIALSHVYHTQNNDILSRPVYSAKVNDCNNILLYSMLNVDKKVLHYW